MAWRQGQRKKRLREILDKPVRALAQGQPVQDPHPFLAIWLGCRRFSNDHYQLLPDSGGWLDQDPEIMLAFEVTEEIYREEEQAKRMFDQIRNAPS